MIVDSINHLHYTTENTDSLTTSSSNALDQAQPDDSRQSDPDISLFFLTVQIDDVFFILSLCECNAFFCTDLLN